PAEMPGRMSGFSRVGEHHDRCGVALPRSYLPALGKHSASVSGNLCIPAGTNSSPIEERPATVAGRSSFHGVSFNAEEQLFYGSRVWKVFLKYFGKWAPSELTLLSGAWHLTRLLKIRSSYFIGS